MSGGAPRGSPFGHGSSRRGPRPGGGPGGSRGGPVPPGKLQLLERFFTPPGPPPGAPPSSPSPSSSSSSSGGGEGRRDPMGSLAPPPSRPPPPPLRRGLSRSHERLHPGDPPPASPRGPPRRRGAPHLRVPGGGLVQPHGDIAGGSDPPLTPKGAPDPWGGSGSPRARGGLRRGQSRSQEGLGGPGGGGPPRRWRSLEAVGGPRGGARFSRFLDELTRRVLSPARLRALGWPPRGGAPGGGVEEEEEEEEEEEDVGQDPEVSAGSGGPRDPPPPSAELEALREQIERLQDDYANSQRLNRLLEERVQGLTQALALERAVLTQHVAEVLQRVLGPPPGAEPHNRHPVAAWGLSEATEDAEGPLLPPPAFRDPPGGPLP